MGSIKHALGHLQPEDIPGDLLDLLLDETERALMLVEARLDEPGRRVLDGDPPDDDEIPAEVGEIRLAIAELVDCCPGVQWELERVGERVRAIGPTAGSVELAAHPHLLDLARLSLESFFRLYPHADDYEASCGGGVDADDPRSAVETYEMLGQLLSMLRSRLA